MKFNRIHTVLSAVAGTAMLTAGAASTYAVVSVSLNVFPTDVGNPDNGGAWSLVAKTDNPNGIAAINAELVNVDNGVNPDEIQFNSGIGASDPIFPGRPNERPAYVPFGTLTDLLYGQDISIPGAVIVGVGTAITSDGPDPLGNPAWDDATLIASGTYTAMVPSFTIHSSMSPVVFANELSTASAPFGAQHADIAQAVVRVVPEPSAAVLALGGCIAWLPRRRLRRA